MATQAYDGGIGGKFRKRPFRRPPSTPYDRPVTAVRGARVVPNPIAEAEGRGGGWISKIVDPASRLITYGASRIFSSVFRKRLEAPRETQEENHQPRNVPEEDCTAGTSEVPSSELEERGQHGDKPKNSGSDGIAELEQLLQQKTFTKDEFDRLAELLRSRTVEPLKLQPELDTEKKEKINVSGQANKIGSSQLYGTYSIPEGSLTVPQEEAASPAELAKAYMGSRPSKVASSSISLRNQFFREDKNLPSMPSASKSLDMSVVPRNTTRFSGIPEYPDDGYTPRSRGRTAIYRMSRSPYFKGGELTRDGCTSPSSQWTPRSAIYSSDKQGLKRGSAVLDSDFGSFGPIRRIRQKSNLMSPSKETHSSFSGRHLSSPSTSSFKSGSQRFPSTQKPLLLDEPKDRTSGLQASINEDYIISNASVGLVPSKSSETAQKLLQQLDKLMPSPKEKPSELKAITRDESPSKLTLDMLHGRALRSMDDIDSSKIFNIQGSDKLDNEDNSHLSNHKGSLCQKLDMVEENGHSKPAVSVVKSTPEANGMHGAVVPVAPAKSGLRSANIVISGSAALATPRKPAFKISAPEDSLDFDDDECTARDLSSPLTAGNNDVELKKVKYKNVVSEAAVSENPLAPPSKSITISSSVSFREADKNISIQPAVTQKGIDFTFPVAADPHTNSQPPPTPTMPTQLPNGPSVKKEKKTAPAFSFGSANTSTFSSTTTVVSDNSGITVGAGQGSEIRMPASNDTTMPAEGFNLDQGGKTQKAGDLFKTFGNAVSSGISTTTVPGVFSFGTSVTPSLSNGSLPSPSPTFSVSVSAIPAVAVSETPVNSVFHNNAASSPSSSGLSVSCKTPVFSSDPLFQFGSGTSTAASVQADTSGSTGSEPVPAKAPLFSTSSTPVQSVPAAFSSTGSSISSAVKTASGLSGSGSASLALATSASISSTSNTSSLLATSPLFSSASGGNSSFASSSPFSSTGSSIFSFGASTQSGSSSSSASNSSQISATTATLGAAGGSIFGTQSTQSGSGISQITQSSTSQFGSFSSSPAFGLSNSSSSSFGISTFGSAASGAKPFSSSSVVSFSAGASSSSGSTSSSFVSAATTSLFGSSSNASTPSIFGSTPGSSASPSTGFSFGLASSGSASSPYTFGSSSGSPFSFTSAGATTSSASSIPAQPAFGMPSPAIGFSSGSPGNDQMNVEDSMADDTNQAAPPMVPTFGQPATSSATPSFIFGSPAVQPAAPSVFQFGGHQNPSVPPNPSPFQTGGNLELPPGGSFSLGSGGGDKSGRKIVKVRRDSRRKK